MQTRTANFLRLVIPIVFFVAIGLVGWKLGLFHRGGAVQIVARTSSKVGTIGFPAAFVLIYATLAALALPITPLAYGAGAMFGFVRGSIYVWFASMIAATTGYLLARGILAKAARTMLGHHHEKLRHLRKGNPALTAFRMQVFPLTPFGIFNYAAAISKMPFPAFLLGTAVGIIPGTLLAAFIGDRVVVGVSGNDRKPLVLALAIAIVLIAISFAPSVMKKLKGKKRHSVAA